MLMQVGGSPPHTSPSSHSIPQSPQFSDSSMFVSQPLSASPSQSRKPAAQSKRHSPSSQRSFAFATAPHEVVHEPHAISVSSGVHVPPQQPSPAAQRSPSPHRHMFVVQLSPGPHGGSQFCCMPPSVPASVSPSRG